MSSYSFGPYVEQDLYAIWSYIAQDSPDAADRWIERLRVAFERLAQSPGIGHTRFDLIRSGLLFWPVGSYLVLYRTRHSGVEIVAVTQGARDMPTFLGDRLRK